ncbi:MAG: ATP-dependent DNA helicase RecG [Holosporales bacterium]|nr:ATP-dependent DNA helicase RecG [Holosporales bacterium]
MNTDGWKAEFKVSLGCGGTRVSVQLKIQKDTNKVALNTAMGLFDSIENVIGRECKSRKDLIKRLMGDQIIDALLFMPSYSFLKQRVESPSRQHLNKVIVVEFRILGIEEKRYKSKAPKKAIGLVGNVQVSLVFFNSMARLFRYYLRIGSEVAVCGRLTEGPNGEFQFVHPETICQVTSIDQLVGIHNVYRLTGGITMYHVKAIIKEAVSVMKDIDVAEWIPDDFLEQRDWYSFKKSIEMIHNPQTESDTTLEGPYKQRLCFDEFLAEHIAKRISNEHKNSEGYIIDLSKATLVKKFMEKLPFKLSDDQKKVLEEIRADLATGRPMLRLLQGDVGSGKTVVALLTALLVVENGYQVALLAPTEILVRQHYETFSKMLEGLDVHVDVLTASDKTKRRREALKNLADGTTNIIVGTHSIISNTVKFNKLGFVVVDEQHRFGVNQRLMLINKAENPHILSMTATPIPRTLLLSMHGDVEVSLIKTKPMGRKDIITRAISMNRIDELISSIRNITAKKEKVYWICPLIEENDKWDYTCVIDRFSSLKEFFGDRVAMMHGRMDSAERAETFDKFKGDGVDILVSTTIIEVGLDVPNATVIIIENAERFGLSQMHQLRGRVGRSDLQSFCILLHAELMSDISRERIEIIKDSNDGFYIADKDLILRGTGDILGTKQSGTKEYRILKINNPEHEEIIFKLMRDAGELAQHIDIAKVGVLLKIFTNEETLRSIKQSF